MVAVSKGLFHELAGNADIVQIFERYTSSIKQMNLGPLFTGMTLVKISNHAMTASAAGMPPILIYRAASQTVEQITLKGMPLGGFTDFPYQRHATELHKGNTMLFQRSVVLPLRKSLITCRKRARNGPRVDPRRMM